MATQKLLDKFHIDINQVKKSSKWYNEQVATMKRGNITPIKLLKQGGNQVSLTIKPGSLFMFEYDPKLKDTLPYYDTFPMVFPYKPAPGGFLGLNMHYLGYAERFALFQKLLDINGKTIDENTKIKYSWAMVNSMAQLGTAKACIKHYLNEHVASPYLKIAPTDWATCMLMPVERFVGASKEHIWKESRHK